ncbi:MAG: class II aldolase/adducin family protein [Alicyclobacillus macrosporangiidus]|uniref:class II aldolase/adducin family protein n=1 Tax=Alicyclobacillus macrosporangiidus TaxID=392015 RepID=UPI0026F362E0|nr:class II aldolase/adducin family protein [Alicyclobacillus macrosporangiidus]MCL6598133.1 class II aldolase/adducin family protein [Alicyclobacillus macrosporangiidus]
MSEPIIPPADSVALRLRLAESVRVFEAIGLFDMNGHVSVRVAGGGFLTHGRQADRATVTVRDVIRVDDDGRLVEGEQEPPNEVALHAEVYRARPDVLAVAHYHGQWGNVLTLAEIPLAPVTSVACGLGTDFPVYPHPDSISTPERGREVAKCLGKHKIVMLRAHGTVVTGRSLEEVLVASKYLELNAERQWYVRAVNPHAGLADEEVRRVGDSLWIEKNIEKAWQYYYNHARAMGKLEGVDGA